MSFEFVEQGRESYGPPAPVQIIQEEAEFAQLLALYCERKPKRVLEVGSYAGGTFFHWLQNATPGAVVVSVDMYEDADNTHLYPDWTPEGVEFVVVQGNSHSPAVIDLARVFAPYDFMFIDAGHFENDVRLDWQNYGSMVEHGIVAFHDIAINERDFPTIQVARFWRDLKRKHHKLHFAEFVEGGSGIGVVFI